MTPQTRPSSAQRHEASPGRGARRGNAHLGQVGGRRPHTLRSLVFFSVTHQADHVRADRRQEDGGESGLLSGGAIQALDGDEGAGSGHGVKTAGGEKARMSPACEPARLPFPSLSFSVSMAAFDRHAVARAAAAAMDGKEDQEGAPSESQILSLSLSLSLSLTPFPLHLSRRPHPARLARRLLRPRPPPASGVRPGHRAPAQRAPGNPFSLLFPLGRGPGL